MQKLFVEEAKIAIREVAALLQNFLQQSKQNDARRIRGNNVADLGSFISIYLRSCKIFSGAVNELIGSINETISTFEARRRSSREIFQPSGSLSVFLNEQVP